MPEVKKKRPELKKREVGRKRTKKRERRKERETKTKKDISLFVDLRKHVPKSTRFTMYVTKV